MLVKFESKSNRVKGLAFHATRPWVLSSLHNGSIQLWDYRMGTLVDKFEEHEGPVRGVAFHATQPLIVSGGDDYKIKVWNYKQRKCLFTLTGHLDYIRTVFFHHEYPWIISASDDQTIRIWNWQSRNCIAILTGHNHYVMCAQFHPKDDLIVSASLDQTVRVWDISGLRKKNLSPQNSVAAEDHSSMRMNRGPAHQNDVFGNQDVLVKFVLEGHDRGVNWASFHPTMPLIVSGADDRQVKLWRMSDTKAWEVDTFRGHFNNVSCVVFHPHQDLILSNSEDKTLRIWDLNKRTAIQSFRREHERFWVMAAHTGFNVFAAGHDNGFLVFKLERERPAFAVHQNSAYYVRDKHIRHIDLVSGQDVAVLTIRKPVGYNVAHRAMSYNPAERAIILTSPVDGGQYEIYMLPKDLPTSGQVRDASSEAHRGPGNSAVFVARNRYAILNASSQTLTIRNLNGDNSKQITLTHHVNDISFAGTGQILMFTNSSVVLYDVQQQTQIAELQASKIKYAYWSKDMSHVALVSKHALIIASKNLEQQCHIHETIRIKSGVWDDSGIYIYSTLNHIKYALPTGDKGIIRTLSQTIYITQVSGKSVHYLDREAKPRSMEIDPTEYMFKLALVNRRYDEVMYIIRNSNLVGQAIIAFLRQKGYPEVALQFVQEPRTRFDLAVECGNIDVAFEMAKTIESVDCWAQLATAAAKQGNFQIAEQALQRNTNFDRLSFLYAASGQKDKLKKMGKIAERRGDIMSQFHNALYLGDITEQVLVLRNAGQFCLAYALATRHGMTDLAAEILEFAGKSADDADATAVRSSAVNGKLLVPPTSLATNQESNWPLLPISRGFFEGIVSPSSAANGHHQDRARAPESSSGAGWGDDDEFAVDEVADVNRPSSSIGGVLGVTIGTNEGGEGGWDDADLDLELQGLSISASKAEQSPTSGTFQPPQPGPNPVEMWSRNSPLAVDHVAAGSFETAMQILNRQIGAVNFTSLKPIFLSIFQASRSSVACIPSTLPLLEPIHRNYDEPDSRRRLPILPISFESTQALLQAAYQATEGGRFAEALELFKAILRAALFVVVSQRHHADEIMKLITTAKEYILGLKIETARRDLGEASSARQVELAAYFTHCDMQTRHLMLALNSAMRVAFKAKCFLTCGSFVRRILEIGPPVNIAETARKIRSVVDANPRDEIEVSYDPLNPFTVCSGSYQPIFKGNPTVSCPFCKAEYAPEFTGKVCNICEISKIGATGTGLRNSTEF